ncbi:MAG: hypothetical protein RL514_1258 [Verrucomicrobiota bacterium]|jgi:putative membrane-bound dehydrogenase-like protein
MHPLRHAFPYLLFAISHLLPAAPFSTNANRLAYLDEDNPFYPHRDFPKLTTPQWVGEPGVEAVVILAIDDMRESKKYETFLRPILDRLKQMDGRAPVSIFANIVEPTDPQLQTWLKEGLSLEVHTLAHPCPLLQKGSFTNAWNTYHGGVDLLSKVPGNKPVAFRMPCCDSMNSPSPRFYAEIFNRTSPDGNFLQADSSVMCLLTDDFLKRYGATPRPQTPDPIPSSFRKYFPATTNAFTKKSLANFGTYIEDYPYPYVINRTCWEFPAMVPSDWEAFNAHGPTNAATVADWQLALDAVVRAQGVFTFIFHPHAWIRADQIIQFIDHAERTHGKKVKFLTFKEAVERLNKHALQGHSLREVNGVENGVRAMDANNDGFLDFVWGTTIHSFTRVWKPETDAWTNVLFGSPIVEFNKRGGAVDRQARFGVMQSNGFASFVSDNSTGLQVVIREGEGFGRFVSAPNARQVETSWGHFDGSNWRLLDDFRKGLVVDGYRVATGLVTEWEKRFLILRPSANGGFDEKDTRGSEQERPAAMQDSGVRLRDFDRDGRCELLVSNDKQNALFAWSDTERAWKKLSYALPPGLALVNERGEDNGLRFVDLNGDGFDDLLLSNEKEYAIYLWAKDVKPGLGWTAGWSHKVLHEQRATNHPSSLILHSSSREIPPFVRSGPHRNNGAWFARGQLFVQNEDTAHLPDVVWRKSFSELIAFDMPAPKPPAESQQCFQVRPGFRVELVAAEPLVQSPVAFEWGADGKLWVVEMPDYPLGMDGKGKPGGRVKFLESTRGDGLYDKATVFLDNLPFPTGVMPWRNGVLISAAPDILYAEDTDGDGKADVVKVLFTGFREGNQQHRLNGFEYGLDNWIYGANGDSGGTITCVNTTAPGAPASNSNPQTPNPKPVPISGRDFRFRPDTGEFEAIEGQTQFGRRRDDWGNWFGNNNPTWLWHYWLPDRYLRRNPHLAVKSSKQMLANYSDSTRCFPISTPPIRFNQPQSVNHVTSGCSPTPYRDDLFGPGFASSVFISEPVHNLVHREVLVPDGVSFTSRRAPDELDREFLASTDNWFRPTMLKTGPDGALYIADFYRFVLEHPEWIAPETQARLDLRAGADKGRIWRVVPVGQPRRPVPNLAKLNTTQLVGALDSPSGWQRDTAQRLLVERQDKAAVEALKKMAVEVKNPKVRVQALCTLDGLKSIQLDTLAKTLDDEHPIVRAHSLRASDRLVLESSRRDVKERDAAEEGFIRNLRLRANDASPVVRYQFAFSAGEWGPKSGGLALEPLLLGGITNSAIQLAALSSISGKLSSAVKTLIEFSRTSQPPLDLTEALVRQAVAEKDFNSLNSLLEGSDSTHKGYHQTILSARVLAALYSSLDKSGQTLAQIMATAPAYTRLTLEQTCQSIQGSLRYWVTYPEATLELRQTCIRVLGRDPATRRDDLNLLRTLLEPRVQPALQMEAAATLAQLGGTDSASALLADWKAHSPALREAVLSALLSRPTWIDTLLAAIERGQVAPPQISPAQRQKLTTHPQAALRDRATKLFATTSADRAKVIKDYAVVATLTGSETRGRELFTKNCGVCHKLKGEGREIGPDLAMTATRDTDWLLTAILDPNAAVEARYLGYTAETKSGREFTGIITAETPNNLVMRGADGTEETILRTDLKQLHGSGLSLMPEGMEAALKPQDMADLLDFIRAK